MEPRREGLIWQVLGFLVVIAAVLEIRSAAQQFTWILNQKFVGPMDLVWPYALGVYAGFLLLAGAAAMISGHVLRVMSGGNHRGWLWKLAGLFCCLAGIVAIVAKMTPSPAISTAWSWMATSSSQCPAAMFSCWGSCCL